MAFEGFHCIGPWMWKLFGNEAGLYVGWWSTCNHVAFRWYWSVWATQGWALSCCRAWCDICSWSWCCTGTGTFDSNCWHWLCYMICSCLMPACPIWMDSPSVTLVLSSAVIWTVQATVLLYKSIAVCLLGQTHCWFICTAAPYVVRGMMPVQK